MDNTEQCLTPNHLLFGRKIKLFDPEPIDITHNINFHCKKISNIINLNNVVLIEEKKPRSTWKMGIVVELIKGKDDNVRDTIVIVGVPKANSLRTRPICKFYHIESLRESSDEIVITVNDNTIKERPKREAAILRNKKQKFKN